MKYPSTHDAYLESLTGEADAAPICYKCEDAKKDADYDGRYGCLCEECYAIERANIDFENETITKEICDHPEYLRVKAELQQEYERDYGISGTMQALNSVFGKQ